MKKIVVISPEIPFPVFKGNQNRIDLTIRALIDLGFDVSLICLNASQKERTSISVEKKLREEYLGINKVIVRRHPKFNSYFKGYIFKIKKKINSIFRFSLPRFCNADNAPSNFVSACYRMIDDLQPDYVYVNYIKLSDCVPKSFKGIKIADLHDIQSNIYKESIKQKGGELASDEYMSMLSEEVCIINSYDKVISINKNESEFLSRFIKHEKVYTLPAFAKNNFKAEHEDFLYDILFIGSASPFNVEGIMKFIAKVMPLVKKEIPNVKVAIAGDVSECSAIKKVNDSCYMKLGRVADLSKLYEQSKIIISPIVSGAGMKVKNIEALSYGKPIVATSFSMDGIDVEPGVSAIIADDWREFSKSVIDILNDEKLRLKIAESARTYFENNHSFYAAKLCLRDIILSSKNGSLNKKTNIVNVIKEFPDRKKIRTKALIFSTDAYELISLNIFLAKEMEKLGVYTEFVRMEDTGEHHFLSQGFLVHSLRNKMNRKRRSELKSIYEKVITKSGDFDEVLVYGVDISEDLRVYRKMFPSHFEKPTIDVLVHGVLILEALLSLIDKINPHFLVGWNGNGPHMVFLMKVAAKIKDLPVFHVERGLLPRSIVFDANGVNFKSVYSGSYLPLINEVQRRRAEKFINKYRENSETIVVNSNQLKLDSGQISSKFNLGDSSYVFFPMQIEGDSNIILNSPVYKKMIDVLRDLECVAVRMGIKIICRPHPENKMSILDIEKKFSGSQFVEIDSSVDLHSMIKSSLATVVINSTVGLESLLHGVPTISLGCSLYSHKGVTYDCSSKENIEDVLRKIQSKTFNEYIQHEKLQRLVSMLVDEYLLFLDGDILGSVNSEKIKRMLSKNSIFPEEGLGFPGKPKKVRDYFKFKKKFDNYCDVSNKINVAYQIDEGTRRYLNGAKKPIVTNESLMSELVEKLGDKFNFVDGVDEADLILSNKIKESKLSSEKYYLDEYLELIK